MPFLALSESVAARFSSKIRLVATDMDGTMTSRGRFASSLFRALEDLAERDISVLVVTGRSAGWVGGLVTYLPVSGAIAENGGLFYADGDKPPVPLVPITNFAEHRRELAQVFRALQTDFPRVRESEDNRFRLTDWAFDLSQLSPQALEGIAAWCDDRGWGFTYSSIQGHLKLPLQDKAKGVLQVLGDRFPQLSPKEVVTVGDSPNDASLFDAAVFPHSVGVANIAKYRDRLPYLPQYVTQAEEGDGFCELVDYLRSPIRKTS
ncbi:haloacid dehalogenase-like hydrolase [Geitlerinema sp. FC II]|nr:haloacid dehalogenase-like hydrolase [Geitlerinema sp. FC II]